MTQAVSRTINAAVKQFSAIPGPPSWPIIGSSLMYRFGKRDKTEYHLALLDMYQEYGPLVRENIGGKTIVHVFDPDDIKTVYSIEGKWPIIPPLQETTAMYREQKEMSLGLGNTNGEEWYKLRSNCIQRMLRPKEVSHHLPSVDKTAKLFLQKISDQSSEHSTNQVPQLRELVGRWSLENAGMLVFDKRLGCLDDDDNWGREMVAANAEIFKLSGDLKLSLPLYKFVSTPKWRKLVAAEDRFYSRAIALCDEAIIALNDAVESDTICDDQYYFLSYLLSRPDLSLKDVTVICLSLFSDGLSTTTPTMMFNIHCLAAWPQIQEKVHQEVMEHFPPIDQPVSQNTLSKMQYLKAFVKETFRLWPNGTEVSRYCEEDLTLSGYHIPSGTHLDLNPSVHFRDPNIFPNPNVHNPDRWLRDGEGLDVHPYILTPFGHGTRMCAGRRFAEQDLYVVLGRMVQMFRLEYGTESGNDMDEMGQVYNTLLFPDRQLRMRFIPRN